MNAPAPLTPPECDLQDFPFMPLHVARLRDSDLAAEEEPEACWYAVLLWAASWHQVPAASLPDNDAVLTKLIGLGRDLRTFRKHKAAALRGFVRCSDGRLYHPVVAEQAVDGWRRKLEQRWRTDCARIKKRNQRDRTELPLPTFEAFMARLPPGARLSIVPEDGSGCPEGQHPLSSGTEGGCPQGNGIQETGTGTGTGTGTNLDKEADASLSPEPTTLVGVLEYPELFEAAWKAYRHVKGRSSKKLSHAQWKRLPPSTRQALPAACERYSREGREPNSDCGAPAMERWLRDEKFADWLDAAAGEGEDWPESRWAVAVELWRTEGAWGERLGPTPGEPGCRAPAHLLITTVGNAAA